MPTKAEVEQRYLNILAVRALEQGGLSQQDIKAAPELAAKAMEMAKAKSSQTKPSKETNMSEPKPKRMMNEQEIFNYIAAAPGNYNAATPEERAVYDNIVKKKKEKKAIIPDTVQVATASTEGQTRKEPTASELIANTISSFSDNFARHFNSGR